MSGETSKTTFPASSAATASTVVYVYDIKNLRIADGSIMATVTSANTQAPCV
jgi:choline dehydrogenase-like flavoprotein